MRRNKTVFAILTFAFLSAKFHAQQVEKIKFKKDPSLIYFFQKGTRSDTLSRNRENLFYLVVPDTLKKDISIQVENAQLMPTSNDSLIKLNYLPGFKYESYYSPIEKSSEKISNTRRYEFKTGVDGTSVIPKNNISISLINTRTGGLILENRFIYSQ